MWPMVLDYDKFECRKLLRKYELEAYSSVVTALRAQGDLNIERRKILRDLASILSIPMDRHRSEVRRVLNDERLFTIAYNISGPDVYYEWTIEGKRLVPLLPRVDPQTVYTTLSNTSANEQVSKDMALPEPSQTRSYKLKITDSFNQEGKSTKKIKLKHPEPEKKPEIKAANLSAAHSPISKPIFIETPNLIKEYANNANTNKTVEIISDKSECPIELLTPEMNIVATNKITPELPVSSSLSFAVKTTMGTSMFATKSITPSTSISTVSISSHTTTTSSASSYPKVILVSSNSLASIQSSPSIKKLASPTLNQMIEKQTDPSNSPISKKEDTPPKNIEIIQSNNIKNFISSSSSQTSSILTTNLPKSIFTKSSTGQQQQYIVLPINSKSVPSISNIKAVSPAMQSTSSKPIEITKTKQTLLNSPKIIYQATSSKEGQKTNFIIMKPKFTYSALNLPNKQNKQIMDQGLVTVGLSKVSTVLSQSEHTPIKSSTYRICPEAIKGNSSANEITSSNSPDLVTTTIIESVDTNETVNNDNSNNGD